VGRLQQAVNISIGKILKYKLQRNDMFITVMWSQTIHLHAHHIPANLHEISHFTAFRSR